MLSCRCVAVDGGEQAVLFDRVNGVLPHTKDEGTHFLVPWLQKAIVFDVRTRPRSISSVTGTKGELARQATPQSRFRAGSAQIIALLASDVSSGRSEQRLLRFLAPFSSRHLPARAIPDASCIRV